MKFIHSNLHWIFLFGLLTLLFISCDDDSDNSIIQNDNFIRCTIDGNTYEGTNQGAGFLNFDSEILKSLIVSSQIFGPDEITVREILTISILAGGGFDPVGRSFESDALCTDMNGLFLDEQPCLSLGYIDASENIDFLAENDDSQTLFSIQFSSQTSFEPGGRIIGSFSGIMRSPDNQFKTVTDGSFSISISE